MFKTPKMPKCQILESLVFCSLCNSLINPKRDFFRTCYKDIKIYKVMNPEKNHLCTEYINKFMFDNLWNNGDFGFFVKAIDKHFCGECIIELRPYIHYIDDEMIVLLPSSVELYDDTSSDEETDEENNEENNEENF